MIGTDIEKKSGQSVPSVWFDDDDDDDDDNDGLFLKYFYGHLCYFLWLYEIFSGIICDYSHLSWTTSSSERCSFIKSWIKMKAN